MRSLNPDNGGKFSEQDMQLIGGILANVDKPESLSSMLLARLENGTENEDELEHLPRVVTEFVQEPSNVRQFMVKVVRETIPPSAPGRKRKIEFVHLPKLLERAETLQPAVEALVQVSKAARKRPLIERLQYIQPDYPAGCDYPIKHINRLDLILSDKKLLSQVASKESGVRLVADAIAGAEFDISARYSIQLVREARRAVSRRRSKPVRQKI